MFQPHLGKQAVARWYLPPDVDYRLSLLPKTCKGLVLWVIEAKVNILHLVNRNIIYCMSDSSIRLMHKTECLKDCHEECILWTKLALTDRRDFLLAHVSSVVVWTGTIQGRVAVPGFAASFATKCKGHCWMWNLVCTFVSNVHMVFPKLFISSSSPRNFPCCIYFFQHLRGLQPCYYSAQK